jgi:hypothetical protein
MTDAGGATFGGAVGVTGQLTLGSTITNGTYTYTLPSATGTLALTSDLSGYLPLTGGTLTGALSGTSATFSSSVTASGAKSQFIANGGNSAGAGISLNTTLTTNPTLRRNWGIFTEDQVEGDFVIKCSTAAGGDASSGNTRLAILRDGNVGIGTTSPSYPLHLKNATFSQLYIEGGSAADLILYNSGGSANTRTMVYRQGTGGTAKFFSANDDGTINKDNIIVLQNSTGNVGIGTASPTFKFDVETSSLTVSRFYSNATGKRNNILIQNSANFNYGVFGVVSATGSSNGDVYGLGYSASGSTAFTEVLTYNSSAVVTITSLGTGTVQATSGVLSVISDSKVKDKKGLFVGSALNAINKIEKPQYWNYNEKSQLGESTYSVKQFGLFADDIHEVLGEEFAPTQTQSVYNEETKETKVEPILIDGSISYSMSDRALLSLAIQAIQELKAEIDLLKGEPIIPTDNNLE